MGSTVCDGCLDAVSTRKERRYIQLISRFFSLQLALGTLGICPAEDVLKSLVCGRRYLLLHKGSKDKMNM